MYCFGLCFEIRLVFLFGVPPSSPPWGCLVVPLVVRCCLLRVSILTVEMLWVCSSYILD